MVHIKDMKTIADRGHLILDVGLKMALVSRTFFLKKEDYAYCCPLSTVSLNSNPGRKKLKSRKSRVKPLLLLI